MDSIANLFLFLGSICWLFDFSPLDQRTTHTRLISALAELRDKRTLMRPGAPEYVSPPDPNGNVSHYFPSESAETLIGGIKEMLPNYASDGKIDWEAIIAVGIQPSRIPINESRNTYMPVSWALILLKHPEAGATTFPITPVGQVRDLEELIEKKHEANVRVFIASLLSLGFLLQIISKCHCE